MSEYKVIFGNGDSITVKATEWYASDNMVYFKDGEEIVARVYLKALNGVFLTNNICGATMEDSNYMMWKINTGIK